MSAHRVFVLGESLFADTIIQLLGRYEQICPLGTAKSIEAALRKDPTLAPDVFIIAEPAAGPGQDLTALGEAFPDVPVICADLRTNVLRVFSPVQLQARAGDLIAAITALPQRS